jgi:hypothetical protein
VKTITVKHYCATVFDANGQNELATVVANTYDEVWRMAKEITPHPMLEWVEGGPTGKEL